MQHSSMRVHILLIVLKNARHISFLITLLVCFFRQGYVNDKVPVEVLIEKYLRMDQRRLLIPIATSGNVVISKK